MPPPQELILSSSSSSSSSSSADGPASNDRPNASTAVQLHDLQTSSPVQYFKPSVSALHSLGCVASDNGVGGGLFVLQEGKAIVNVWTWQKVCHIKAYDGLDEDADKTRRIRSMSSCIYQRNSAALVFRQMVSGQLAAPHPATCISGRCVNFLYSSKYSLLLRIAESCGFHSFVISSSDAFHADRLWPPSRFLHDPLPRHHLSELYTRLSAPPQLIPRRISAHLPRISTRRSVITSSETIRIFHRPYSASEISGSLQNIFCIGRKSLDMLRRWHGQSLVPPSEL